jgi:hypothetical protein
MTVPTRWGLTLPFAGVPLAATERLPGLIDAPAPA